tara:strand:+ start:1866 stop:2093 length:228 start_codon:yes stop_codon:yes gene_type:complete
VYYFAIFLLAMTISLVIQLVIFITFSLLFITNAIIVPILKNYIKHKLTKNLHAFPLLNAPLAEHLTFNLRAYAQV